MLGDLEDEVLELVGRLIRKLRRQLAVKHLRADHSGSMASDVGRGEIGPLDHEFNTGPILTIDGKTVSWEQLGVMVSGYEGFQFKLEIQVLSDEF